MTHPVPLTLLSSSPFPRYAKTCFARSLLVVALGASLPATAAIDKLRLVLTDDPATTATIGWNQRSGHDPMLRYDVTDHGTLAAAYAKTQAPSRQTWYRGMDSRFVRLRHLQPNTRYNVVITDSEGTTQRYWFKTAPADRSRLSVVAGGDSRNHRDVRRKANLLVAKLRPHVVLFGGDMVDVDNDAEWREWLDDWQLTTTSDGRLAPIVPTRGNHEGPGTVAQLFDLANANEYGALTFGDRLMRVYTLNTEISVAGDQRTWLAGDLAASQGVLWKVAQYHRPMRPHTSAKSDGWAQYTAWAQLFYEAGVRLAVECDSHVSKTTFPIRPSAEAGQQDGFIRDEARGTVFTGEGCWGAPLKPADRPRSWTRSIGAFNEFKWLWVSETGIEHRTVRVDNAYSVGEVSDDDRFRLPQGLDVFAGTGEAAFTILPIGAVGTGGGKVDPPPTACTASGPCDDGDATTTADEWSASCVCGGVPTTTTRVEVAIAGPTDDAEENIERGSVNLWSSDLELIDDWGAQLVALRFTNVVLPKGARIYRAYLQFTVDQPSAASTSLTIAGERVGNSAPLLGDLRNLSQRTPTSAQVAWPNLPRWDEAGQQGTAQRSPDLAPILTEVASLADWQAGQALTLLVRGTGHRVATSAEGQRPTRLVIYYGTEGGDGTVSCPPAGQACDDGRAETQNDRTDGACGCAGTVPTCPAAGQVCDDGRAETTNDRTDGTCGCAGAVPTCPAAGQVCDDGRAETQNDRSDGRCGCSGTTTSTSADVSVSYAIQTGDDDVEESVGTRRMYVNSSDLELSEDPGSALGNQLIGLRFTGIAVPPGAVIKQAYVQFVADESHMRATNLQIRAERIASAAPFRNVDGDVSRRTLTAAAVAWSGITPWTAGERGEGQRTPDLSAVLTELVQQPEWRAGGAVAFVMSGTGQRVAVAYEGGRDAVARLLITYAAGVMEPTGGGGVAGRRARDGSGVGRSMRLDAKTSFGAGDASEMRVGAGLQVFPNPAQDVIFLRGLGAERWSGGEVVDAQGRRVLRLVPGAREVSVAELPAGYYLVRVWDDAGERWSARLVVGG